MGWGWTALAAAAVAAVAYVAVKLMEVLWWRPRRVERHFARQGIRGPRYRFFVGCVREMVALMVAASAKPMPRPYRSHNVLPRVLAFYHHWKKIYGTPTPLGTCSCSRLSHRLVQCFFLFVLTRPTSPLLPARSSFSLAPLSLHTRQSFSRLCFSGLSRWRLLLLPPLFGYGGGTE